MDIADLIGFIDLEEATAVEPLEAEDYENELTAYSTKRQRVLDGPEYIFDGFESAATDGFGDSGMELEIELDLSTIDLSSLDQWEGTAAPESTAFVEQPRVFANPSDDGEESPEFIFQPVFIRSQAQYEAEEADDSAIENGEIPMLSTEMREFLEYLPAFEEEEDLSEPVELTDFLGPCRSYSPRRYTYAPMMKVQSELPVVGEGESWTEAEFLEDVDSQEIAYPESEADLDDAELASLGASGFVVYRDGVFRVNEEYIGSTPPVLDPGLRELVDSVLGAPRA
ncbi:MAG: hypothetical protein Q8M76_09025 [Spirochaetaceae bacterium]|nr:hypothetical protein [Spirochaetaceae bacterium]